jgi:hypothetical protein
MLTIGGNFIIIIIIITHVTSLSAPVKRRKWSAEKALLVSRLKELELENAALKKQQQQS